MEENAAPNAGQAKNREEGASGRRVMPVSRAGERGGGSEAAPDMEHSKKMGPVAIMRSGDTRVTDARRFRLVAPEVQCV